MEAQSRRDISSNSDVSPTPIADTAETVDEAFVHRQTWPATLQPCRLCEIQKQCPPTRLRRFHLRLRLRWTRRRTSFACDRERSMAERVGFEPTCPLQDKTLSRRPRYDHFGTS